MGDREIRSPWSLDRNERHPQRAISPGSRSNPDNDRARADGHILRHIGKSGPQPVSAKHNTPIPPRNDSRR
jgi:hypothetical protein